VRQALGRRAAPEFEDWLLRQGLVDDAGRPIEKPADAAIAPALALIESMAAR
jgi:ethanolamine ammonia-lyase large subunit